MKKVFTFLAVLCVAVCSFGQNAKSKEVETKWYDGAEFPVYGKATDQTPSRYDRLPASYKQVSRKPLWQLGRNTAGLYIRFRSDSPFIKIAWTSRYGRGMNHMAATGVRGVDLYWLDNGQWKYARTGRPGTEKTSEYTMVSNMEPVEREWMLYLSLYDGVTDVKIGIDPKSHIDQPKVNSPAAGNQIVFYGTSIMQGGCVTRPGMLATSILSRKLDREMINLGFSGNAFLDLEIAELMAQVESPAIFVLDNVPNSTVEMINERGEQFFNIIRKAHPDVPVIFVERPIYPHSYLDQRVKKDIDARNAAQRALYQKLRKAGQKKLYYLESEKIYGEDREDTVDGTHATDLGAIRYVEAILPVIKKAL